MNESFAQHMLPRFQYAPGSEKGKKPSAFKKSDALAPTLVKFFGPVTRYKVTKLASGFLEYQPKIQEYMFAVGYYMGFPKMVRYLTNIGIGLVEMPAVRSMSNKQYCDAVKKLQTKYHIARYAFFGASDMAQIHKGVLDLLGVEYGCFSGEDKV